ncbi:hypothetical protein EGR_00951 [Echinococcus granulosus]|uniref:Uncharacterized protein n=2 Tax=Echinococcus granulosus TaxID=6210 RepID=W6V0I8_ECHGR|nr:hypothetical protein EGR_00951 [Echinococcus granulosus]EUB64407.1 hypothetical protein EGR_00951 [Echinococcus granulosus]
MEVVSWNDNAYLILLSVSLCLSYTVLLGEALVTSKTSAFQNDRLSSRGRRYNLLSRDRLNVPIRDKEGRYLKQLSDEQSQRLISISSDEEVSVDIYNTHFMSSLAGDEMIEVLRRDGYNLDRPTTTVTDYPDLDLVPPHVITERRSVFSRLPCCSRRSSCSLM